MEWTSIRAPMTITEVEQAEKALKVILPNDYKQVIGSINGGALRGAWVNVPGVGEVPYSRNVSLHKDAVASVFDLFDAVNCGTKNLFPFGSVGNGDYFCFELTCETVVLYLHETQTTVYVCDSYSQLLESLNFD